MKFFLDFGAFQNGSWVDFKGIAATLWNLNVIVEYSIICTSWPHWLLSVINISITLGRCGWYNRQRQNVHTGHQGWGQTGGWAVEGVEVAVASRGIRVGMVRAGDWNRVVVNVWLHSALWPILLQVVSRWLQTFHLVQSQKCSNWNFVVPAPGSNGRWNVGQWNLCMLQIAHSIYNNTSLGPPRMFQ